MGLGVSLLAGFEEEAKKTSKGLGRKSFRWLKGYVTKWLWFDYSGITKGLLLGNFAIVALSMFRVSATISGGEWVSQSDSEMSA